MARSNSMISLNSQDTKRLERLQARQKPEWFGDAKLGIMFHWGPSSIPAWAPSEGEIGDIAAKDPENSAALSPYAEWYFNSMRLEGSLTAAHHAMTYGADYPYDRFVETFRSQTEKADPDAWADLIKRVGAGYVVLVTKHHDGVLLWPSQIRNPNKQDWQIERDLVGELAKAVRKRGIEFGLYYSGGLDWTFEPGPSRNLLETLMTIPTDQTYADYCLSHFRELIERYEPDYLWNDIGIPSQEGLLELIEDYYTCVPTGLVNDRWLPAREMQAHLAAHPEALTRLVEKVRAERRAPPAIHSDVVTPEYAQLDGIQDGLWESVRGVGHSFSYNQNEPDSAILQGRDLIILLSDIVSKGGNLLLNIALRSDGTPCPKQARSAQELGTWLQSNGEAIYATRPVRNAVISSPSGHEIRLTQRGNTLYAVVWASKQNLGTPCLQAPGLTHATSLSGQVSLASKDGLLQLPHSLKATDIPIVLKLEQTS